MRYLLLFLIMYFVPAFLSKKYFLIFFITIIPFLSLIFRDFGWNSDLVIYAELFSLVMAVAFFIKALPGMRKEIKFLRDKSNRN